jgi:hypothetical protein
VPPPDPDAPPGILDPAVRPADPLYSPRLRERSLELSMELGASHSFMQAAAALAQQGTQTAELGSSICLDAIGEGDDLREAWTPAATRTIGADTTDLSAPIVQSRRGKQGSRPQDIVLRESKRVRAEPARDSYAQGSRVRLGPADETASLPDFSPQAPLLFGSDFDKDPALQSQHSQARGPRASMRRSPRPAAPLGEARGGTYAPEYPAAPRTSSGGYSHGPWEHPPGAPYMAQHILPEHEREERAESASSGLGIGSRAAREVGVSANGGSSDNGSYFVPGAPYGQERVAKAPSNQPAPLPSMPVYQVRAASQLTYAPQQWDACAEGAAVPFALLLT